MAEGIDVYVQYQTVTDWNAVRAAGKTFCYVKASDGTAAKSTNGYGPAGRSAGIAMGAYHYAQPGDPIAQADLLVSQATSGGLTDLGPALDLEAPFTPGQTAANFAIAFLRRLRDRGFLPVLYGSDSMLSYVAPQVRAAVPETWIWVARYGASPKTPYGTWQYSDTGNVSGISASAVDLSTGSVPVTSSSKIGAFMALTDAQQADLYTKVVDLYNDASSTWTATGGAITQGKALAKVYQDVEWMAANLGNTPDVNHDGKQGDTSLVDFRQLLFDKLTALTAPQAAAIDLDALAAKVAPLVAAAVGDSVAAAVATELSKRLES